MPDAAIEAPTDAVVRVVRACVCGSDLHPFHTMEASAQGTSMGHALIGGDDTRTVLEAVGHLPAYEMAVGAVRAGGTISRVGVPQYEEAGIGFASLFGRNITLTGRPAPVRARIEELLPDVLEGRLDPGRAVGLEEVPEGYRAMDAREALKVLVRP